MEKLVFCLFIYIYIYIYIIKRVKNNVYKAKYVGTNACRIQLPNSIVTMT